MGKRILFMTSTIQPRTGEPLLARTDPKERLEDYKKALLFYSGFINRGIDRIVFVDNSGYNLNELIQVVQHQAEHIEFLSYSGLDYDLSFGRGYGEFKLMDWAMEQSASLKNCLPDDLILKITGRYVMLNFDACLRKLPAGYDFYTNFRNRPIYWADMFFMAWKKTFYDLNLKGIYPMLKLNPQGEAPEVVFRRYLEEQCPACKISKRYPVIPRIDAPKGMNNKGYRNLANSAKYYVRVITNALFPGLWI